MQQPQPESAHRRASSSSTCSTAPGRTIGCMAGLIRLFSPYHRTHRRKRLVAAKNGAQQPPSPAPSPPPSSSTPNKKAEESPSSPFLSPVKKPMQKKQQQHQPQQPTTTAVWRRRSCDAPRSPTIALEHRRRSSCDSPRPPPPAIVARLMGLEDSAPPSPATAASRWPVLPTRPPPPPPHSPPETAAEKRRKLLGALEKCDEDLKTLRRIIAAVRAAEMRAAAAASDVVPPPGNGGAAKWPVLGRARDEQLPSPPPPQHEPRAEVQYQYPSPDSVLDAISSPRFPCRKRPSPCTDLDAGSNAGRGNGTQLVPGARTKIVKPSRTFVFSGDYCKIKAGDDELHRHSAVSVATRTCTLLPRLPRAAGAESCWRHHRRRWELEAAAAGRVISCATVESVGEVVWGQQCGAAEQRWERDRVAAALERAVLHDLVSDTVAELLAQSGHGHGAGCRKRLRF